jgi:hypothetical protein
MAHVTPPLDAELIARHNASRINALRDDVNRRVERQESFDFSWRIFAACTGIGAPGSNAPIG